MPAPASAIAAQVRAASRCCSAKRAMSAVNSGASAIVTSTLATVVNDRASMKAVNITAQQMPDSHSARPPLYSDRPSATGPRITPSNTISASALKALRQNVSSKPCALSSQRVTTPAMLHISVARTISATARPWVMGLSFIHRRGAEHAEDRRGKP